ncbi:DUF2809 domain-containing protein [Vagococcus sp. BWB3-3]|uniref:DUF2809 domain-containing protein n=1 Tax=Vagococcus allomyrinae TaxID=2794353 RepID=A0A940P7D1_9ENTE|nr:DUF2809 domain-containing protein [Vagococcus allomyrinae]
MKKRRMIYAVATILTMASGLLTRKVAFVLPEWVNAYLGDGLWALMVFFCCSCLFPKLSSLKRIILALIFCYLIEISQLYQGEWLNQIRQTTLGGLVLGYGFLWSDLLSYTVGVLAGGIMSIKIDRHSQN